MPFPVPENTSESLDHAIAAVNRYNETERNIYVQAINCYEFGWGVSGSGAGDEFVSNGSVYTLEQMQEILDCIGKPTVEDLFAAGEKLFDFMATYPGDLPVRYLAPAFDYVIDASAICGVRLTGLAQAWQVPPEEIPVNA